VLGHYGWRGAFTIRSAELNMLTFCSPSLLLQLTGILVLGLGDAAVSLVAIDLPHVLT